MLWFLLWLALVLFALGLYAVLGWGLWRRSRALFHELNTAMAGVSAVTAQVDALRRPAASDPELAVFADPQQLRRERRRAAGRRGRGRGRGTGRGGRR